MQSSINDILNETQQNPTWLTVRKAARQIRACFESAGQTPRARLKVAFVSSFTVDPLADYLTVQAARCDIALDTYISPYGQVSQEVLNPQSALYAFGPDITFLIVQPETLSQNPLTAADQLTELARAFEQNTSGVLVPATFIAAPDWPLHLLPSQHQTDLQKANQQLKTHFAEKPRTQLCDLDTLAAYYGYADARSPQMEAMARIPFAEGFLDLLARKLTAHLKIRAGILRKCLVLDCDNTLWGGIIGEDGLDGIALGPDWPGREFVDFQKAILELYAQGVILAINSKNNEADVLEVLRTHPHMLLKEHHFAGICINWNPKPQNMETLAEAMNIGLDSLVFVDDNPAERQLMRQMLPGVETLDLPANPALYAKALRETTFFAAGALTAEDKQRGAMYAAQRQRTQLEKTAVSLDDYLKSLEMVCSIRTAEDKDIKRIAQLTQRTNQFNLTTRRYTEAEIRQMHNSPDWTLYVLGLADKFGDNGTVGLALVQTKPKASSASDTMANTEPAWQIDTFLMSCRVIGRQAEDALVDRICRDAVAAGVQTLTAEYIPTQKNALVADFWTQMGFQQSRDPDTIGRAGFDDADSHPAGIENTTRYQCNLENYTPKTFEYLTFE